MYVASHAGKSWKAKPGAPAVGFSSAAAAGWGFFGTETFSPRRHRDKTEVLEKPDPGGPLRGLVFLRASVTLRWNRVCLGTSRRPLAHVCVQTAAKAFTRGLMLADFEKLTLCCSKDCRRVTAVSKLHGWTRGSMHPIIGAPEARCTR
jgi:hypothetical protein